MRYNIIKDNIFFHCLSLAKKLGSKKKDPIKKNLTIFKTQKINFELPKF